MWFHDLSLLRLPADATIDPAELESALAQHPLRSPGPLEFETTEALEAKLGAAEVTQDPKQKRLTLADESRSEEP